MANGKVSVTITYRAPGTKPPLFVAGSFSDPQWDPQPMEYTTGEDGEYTFTKKLDVAPASKIQYKFKVEGNWWILNEEAPTITDDAGNKNNILEAPPLDKPVTSTEPETTKPQDQNETSTDDDPRATNDEPKQPQIVSKVDALKHPEEIDRSETATPEFAKTAAEVADSAALLDAPTPEPRISEEIERSETGILEFANTAAEVADSAALLDAPTPEPRISEEIERSETGIPEFANTAAEVADSAALLDAPTPEPRVSEEVAGEAEDPQLSLNPTKEVAEEAAEVAVAAKTLDTDEPEVHLEAAQPAYTNLADIKADIKDNSVDVAGFSNDADPIPLFAHECAGLYENDEISGAKNAKEQEEIINGRARGNEEDFDDPTLEKFPSTRYEIMSTVRRVESGLNADPTLVEGVPPSPIVQSRNQSTTDFSDSPEHLSPESSPVSTRASQRLPLPRKLSRGSLSDQSLSQSLGSIAEGAEGEEAEKSTAEEIAPVVEQAETADEAIKVAKETEGEVPLTPPKLAVQPVVTVPSPSTKANTGLLSPASDEDEAVVLKDGKDKYESVEFEQSGYLTPERAATPNPEEPGSPREPAPNTAAPRSPKIVISQAEDPQPEEELVQAPPTSETENELKDVETHPSASEMNGSDSRGETAATSSAIEDTQPTSVRKRPAARGISIDRAATPHRVNETGREAAKNGSWFTAFFRLVFVDWVGGFVSRLCGSRRKTLIATGVALVAIVGAASWSRLRERGTLGD